jgi:hypothetical protein
MAVFALGSWVPRLAVTAGAGLALLAVGTPQSGAAPTADGRGYVDSTARCPTVASTILFGSTDMSRLAICATSGGGYQYRGVRLRDGAKLIVPAKQDADGAYVAESDGFRYVVTSTSLAVSDGPRLLREEPMVDFHGTETPVTAAKGPAPAPTAQSVPDPATPTPTTPLPPPLAAEVGGGGR